MRATSRRQPATLSRRQVLALLAGFGVSAEALAQDAARVNPNSYRVLFENERIRVLEYLSRPGRGVCGQGVHSHPAHLTVALTAARVRVRLADGRTIVATNEAGDVLWEEAATHATENIGGTDVRAYIVEIKGSDWRPSTG